MEPSLVEKLIEAAAHLGDAGGNGAVEISLHLVGLEEAKPDFTRKWIVLCYRDVYLLLVKDLKF